MEKYKMIHIRLSEKLHRQVRLICADKDVTIQDYVEELIQKDISKKKGGIKL